jgi:hypothetical protein
MYLIPLYLGGALTLIQYYTDVNQSMISNIKTLAVDFLQSLTIDFGESSLNPNVAKGVRKDALYLTVVSPF